MSAVASAIGGIFSVIVLIIAAPLLARVAYSFGPPEYFALAVFGLSMVAMTGGDSAVKNLIAGAFGVLLATVGQDLTTGVERYTFGIHSFTDGIEFIPVLIGLFALAELFEQASAARQAHWRGEARRGAPAELAGHQGLLQGDLALERARHLHRHPAGARRHHRGDDRLRRDQALVEEQGGVRQGRDRGRRRAGGGEQRRGRRRDGADARARHSRAAPPPRSSSPA